MRRWLLLAAVLAGCPRDQEGPDLHEFPDAFHRAFCNTFARCRLVEDVATCLALENPVQVSPALEAAVTAGRVVYHEDEAGICVAGLNGLICQTGRTFTIPDACNKVFTGQVPGGACPNHPHLGEPCVRDKDCFGSFCDASTQKCLRLETLGESCTSDAMCLVGVCAGTCVLLPDPGERCVPDPQAATCRFVGTFCSPTSRTCVPIGLAGAPCSSNVDCSPLYPCDTASGTCTAPEPEDATRVCF